jgi:hypothetical protein
MNTLNDILDSSRVTVTGAARCNAGGIVRFVRHQSGEAYVELVDEQGEFQCAAMMAGMSTMDLIDFIVDISA